MLLYGADLVSGRPHPVREDRIVLAGVSGDILRSIHSQVCTGRPPLYLDKVWIETHHHAAKRTNKPR